MVDLCNQKSAAFARNKLSLYVFEAFNLCYKLCATPARVQPGCIRLAFLQHFLLWRALAVSRFASASCCLVGVLPGSVMPYYEHSYLVYKQYIYVRTVLSELLPVPVSSYKNGYRVPVGITYMYE